MEGPGPKDPSLEEIEQAKRVIKHKNLKLLKSKRGYRGTYQPKTYKIVSGRGKGMLD